MPNNVYVSAPANMHVPSRKDNRLLKLGGIRVLVLRGSRRLGIFAILVVGGKFSGMIIVIMCAIVLVIVRGMVKLALAVIFALLLHRDADIASSFITEFKVIFNVGMVFDSEENDGCGD